MTDREYAELILPHIEEYSQSLKDLMSKHGIPISKYEHIWHELEEIDGIKTVNQDYGFGNPEIFVWKVKTIGNSIDQRIIVNGSITNSQILHSSSVESLKTKYVTKDEKDATTIKAIKIIKSCFSKHPVSTTVLLIVIGLLLVIFLLYKLQIIDL